MENFKQPEREDKKLYCTECSTLWTVESVGQAIPGRDDAFVCPPCLDDMEWEETQRRDDVYDDDDLYCEHGNLSCDVCREG